MKPYIRYWIVSLLLFLTFGLFGLDPGDVTVTLTSGPLVMIDNNKPCPPDLEGPLNGYITFEVCNTSGGTLTGLEIELGSFTNGGFGLAGGQNASQLVGTLENDSCKTFYWFIGWPCIDGEVTNMTATVSDQDPGTVSTTTGLETEIANSASAGGILVSKIIGPGAYVGQVIYMDVDYEFGNIQNGDEISFQPIGNDDFDAGCLQLINLEVTYSEVNSIDVGLKDQLFFTATARTSGSGNQVDVRYYFKYNCIGVSTTAYPYAFANSGNKLKYTPNYDTQIPDTFPVSQDPFMITKSVTPDSVGAGDTALYTITISNISLYNISVDSLIDLLPSGFSFRAIQDASDITTSNSTVVPSDGDSGTLNFVSGVASAIFPYYEYVVSAASTISLVYSVDVGGGVVSGEYSNSALAATGSYRTSTVSAELCVECIRCVLPCSTFPLGN